MDAPVLGHVDLQGQALSALHKELGGLMDGPFLSLSSSHSPGDAVLEKQRSSMGKRGAKAGQDLSDRAQLLDGALKTEETNVFNGRHDEKSRGCVWGGRLGRSKCTECAARLVNLPYSQPPERP